MADSPAVIPRGTVCRLQREKAGEKAKRGGESGSGRFLLKNVEEEEAKHLYYDLYDPEGKSLRHIELGEYSLFVAVVAVEQGCLLYDNREFILYDKTGEAVWEKPSGKIQFDVWRGMSIYEGCNSH